MAGRGRFLVMGLNLEVEQRDLLAAIARKELRSRCEVMPEAVDVRAADATTA